MVGHLNPGGKSGGGLWRRSALQCLKTPRLRGPGPVESVGTDLAPCASFLAYSHNRSPGVSGSSEHKNTGHGISPIVLYLYFLDRRHRVILFPDFRLIFTTHIISSAVVLSFRSHKIAAIIWFHPATLPWALRPKRVRIGPR